MATQLPVSVRINSTTLMLSQTFVSYAALIASRRCSSCAATTSVCAAVAKTSKLRRQYALIQLDSTSSFVRSQVDSFARCGLGQQTLAAGERALLNLNLLQQLRQSRQQQQEQHKRGGGSRLAE